MRYRYWILRYVPDVRRDESVNVGVIVSGSEPGDAAIRTVTQVSEIPDIGGPRKEATYWLANFQHKLTAQFINRSMIEIGEGESLDGTLHLFSHHSQGFIQSGPPHTIAAETADQAADFVFSRLIERPKKEGSKQHRTRLRKKFLAQYRNSKAIAQYLEIDPSVKIDGRKMDVDAAIIDTHHSELTSAFSFKAKPSIELENKVDSWTLHVMELRDSASKISFEGKSGRAEVFNDIPIVAVVDLPQTAEQHALYKATTSKWGRNGIEIVPSEDFESHVRELEYLLVS